jgi:hypothetical protein
MVSETGAPNWAGQPSDRRKLIAVVHADVVGYSRLIGLDDSGTLDRMRRLRREVVQPALAAHGGRIVNTAGDSLLMVFDSVDGATRFAASVQQQVPSHDGAPADRAIRFRIGINVGDVIPGGHRCFQGLFLAWTGRGAEAREYLRTAIRLNPHDQAHCPALPLVGVPGAKPPGGFRVLSASASPNSGMRSPRRGVQQLHLLRHHQWAEFARETDDEISVREHGIPVRAAIRVVLELPEMHELVDHTGIALEVPDKVLVVATFFKAGKPSS